MGEIYIAGCMSEDANLEHVRPRCMTPSRVAQIKRLRESWMRENCTSSLSGGRRPARERSSAPPPTRQQRDRCNGGGAKGRCHLAGTGDQPGNREESCMTCKPYDIPKTLMWGAWLH